MIPLVAVVFILAAATTTSPVYERLSAVQALYTQCPNGVALSMAKGEFDLAMTSNDVQRWNLARKLAGEYYRCYATVSAPHARDWAHLLFEHSLWVSLRSNTAVEGRSIDDAVNQICERTHYADVRKWAQEERSAIRYVLRRLEQQ